jgi:hypothetical protein
MKFKYYLNEAGDYYSGYYKKERTIVIDHEQAIKWIKRYSYKVAMVYKNDSTSRIYRNLSKSRGDVLISKGTEERRSRNTSNFYTLFINYDKRWADFPKREIVCLSDLSWGGYLIFPADNTKLGICPDADMWYTKIYYNIHNHDKEINMEEFNSLITHIIKYCRDKNIAIPSDVEFNMNNLKSFFKTIDKKIIPEINKNEKYSCPELLIAAQQSNMSLYDICSKMLDPQKLSMKVETVGCSLPKNIEVWCEAPAVGIYTAKNLKYIDQVLEEILS